MSSVGEIKAVNVSKERRMDKHNIQTCEVTMEGFKGDAHAGPWHRQITLLAMESIDKMKYLGLDLTYGTFAENITTHGVELHTHPVGTKLRINNVLLEVTQIGKDPHELFGVLKQVGTSIMFTEGIFTKVLQPGRISVDDRIEVV